MSEKLPPMHERCPHCEGGPNRRLASTRAGSYWECQQCGALTYREHADDPAPGDSTNPRRRRTDRGD
jgi:hypothetical protein